MDISSVLFVTVTMAATLTESVMLALGLVALLTTISDRLE